MKKQLLAIAALASSLLLNQVASADSSFCKQSLSDMVKSIKLDDTEKSKIQPILDKLKTGLKSAGEQMNSLEPQIKQAVNSPNMDEGKLQGLVDQKTKLIGDVMKMRLMAENQILYYPES